MKIIRLYKSQRATAWSMVGLGVAALVLGGWGLVLTIKTGFDTRFLGGNWIHVIHIFQGVVFINLGYSLIKKENYYVGWNNSEIRYIIPGCKHIEIIKINEISEIDLKFFKVNIRIGDSIKVLEFKDIEYKPLRQIKSYFEELQSALQKDETKKASKNQ